MIQRQLKRLTERLAKLDDTHLDAALTKAEEMGRQLAAKRQRLKELQQAGRRPNVMSVKEKDVAALTQLRDLLQGDVGAAAQVLKALVGDVVITTQQVEGQEKPQMVARFTINAVPALAVFDRGRAAAHDDSDVSIWESLNDDRETPSDRSLNQGAVSVPLLRPLPRKR
jgi:hypothetical protein